MSEICLEDLVVLLPTLKQERPIGALFQIISYSLFMESEPSTSP
jgi:hypothetical protein